MLTVHFSPQLEEKVTAHKRLASFGDTAGIGGNESLYVIPSEVEGSRAVFGTQERTNMPAIWLIGPELPREIDFQRLADQARSLGYARNDGIRARYAEQYDLASLRGNHITCRQRNKVCDVGISMRDFTSTSWEAEAECSTLV